MKVIFLTNIFLFQDSSTPPEHTDYVWRHFISVAKAKKIALIAHSFGGICSVGLVRFSCSWKSALLDVVSGLTF